MTVIVALPMMSDDSDRSVTDDEWWQW
jgi:hypothetical protein